MSSTTPFTRASSRAGALVLGAVAAGTLGLPAAHAAAPVRAATSVPGLSINDVSQIERGGPATFTVTLSAPSTSAVTVAVSTADGTAKAPADYTAVDTTVTFQPGQTSTTVSVEIVSDILHENNETYSVDLSAPTGAVIVDGQGIGTILNDDFGGTL